MDKSHHHHQQHQQQQHPLHFLSSSVPFQSYFNCYGPQPPPPPPPPPNGSPSSNSSSPLSSYPTPVYRPFRTLKVDYRRPNPSFSYHYPPTLFGPNMYHTPVSANHNHIQLSAKIQELSNRLHSWKTVSIVRKQLTNNNN